MVPTDIAVAVPEGCYGRIGRYVCEVYDHSVADGPFCSSPFQHGMETSH